MITFIISIIVGIIISLIIIKKRSMSYKTIFPYVTIINTTFLSLLLLGWLTTTIVNLSSDYKTEELTVYNIDEFQLSTYMGINQYDNSYFIKVDTNYYSFKCNEVEIKYTNDQPKLKYVNVIHDNKWFFNYVNPKRKYVIYIPYNSFIKFINIKL